MKVPSQQVNLFADRIVIHLAGADRPGVTCKLAEIIANEQATLVNIGQSVLHGYLMLSAIVDIPPNSHALRRILLASSELGMRLEATPFDRASRDAAANQQVALCVTLLGLLGDGGSVAAVTHFLASRQMNILEIRTLSDDALTGIELIATVPQGAAVAETQLSDLRAEILSLSSTLAVDIAVQKEDIFRRNKRLVCMDVDSTFVQTEFIDELAEAAGCKPQVAQLTERAMRGELDFQQSLQARLALLKGLPMQMAKQICENTPITPGAADFVRILKTLGFRVGLVSGGFDFFTDYLKNKFGLDFAFANELEVVDGRLTGNVQGTVLDAQRKAQILRDMAKVYKFRLEQTIAIGDGANDIQMLKTAGLGVAFHGKPKVQEVADMSLNFHERMDTLLFLMGFAARDLKLINAGQ